MTANQLRTKRGEDKARLRDVSGKSCSAIEEKALVSVVRLDHGILRLVAKCIDDERRTENGEAGRQDGTKAAHGVKRERMKQQLS